jgi:hypothetical protein
MGAAENEAKQEKETGREAKRDETKRKTKKDSATFWWIA